MALSVRTTTPSEIERFMQVHRTGFSQVWDDDLRARNHEFLASTPGQTLHAAFDGDEMVGTALSLELTIALPGGTCVPATGLTWVATLPNHRRKGVMSALLDAHLTLAGEQGAAVSVLTAVESALYGRYAYGVATYDAVVTVTTAHISFREPPTGRQIRFVEPADSVPAMQRVWNAVQQHRAGMTNRPDAEVEWWTAKYDGFLIVAVDDAGEVDGYAAYTVDRNRSPTQHADDTVKVDELIASSPEAYAALWSTLISLDGVGEVSARCRPVDELLPHLVTAPRRVDRSHIADGLWVRPLDVAALLRARAYRPGPACVIDVAGERFRVDPSDGSVETTDAAADVTMGVAAFGALVFGGQGAAMLGAAGQIAGDAAAADTLLGWPLAPWSPLQF